MQAELGWNLLLVKRPKWKRRMFGQEFVVPGGPEEQPRKFPVLPKRWVVERTFAWLGRYRRFAKDYEQLCETVETLIQMASARLITSRFANGYF